MKKFLLISILLAGLFLTGCSQQKLSKNNLFEKKQECSKYKDNILKSINEENKLYHTERALIEIQYSPTLDSCIIGIQEGINYYYIQDILTNEEIQISGQYLYTKDVYEKKIRELKGE